jgi:hypothetical protein
MHIVYYSAHVLGYTAVPFHGRTPKIILHIPRKLYLTGQKTREAFGSSWKLLQYCHLTGKKF